MSDPYTINQYHKALQAAEDRNKHLAADVLRLRTEFTQLAKVAAHAAESVVHARAEVERLQARLAKAERLLPKDSDMIEHNPDEGIRLFCCDGKVRHMFPGPDVIEHAIGCWYIAVRSALAPLTHDPKHADSAGEKP